MRNPANKVPALCAVVAFLAAMSAAPGAHAAGKTPTQAYQDYVAAAHAATTLDALYPHLSKAYRAMLQAQPKDRAAVWLERLKDSADLKDLKISKETITGTTCTLEGTATSAKGNPVHGKVSMVLEDGAWRLDEQGWAT